MISNFFKIAFRNLLHNKGASFLNIFGLATGLAASLMIMMWIQHELSFDKFFKDIDQLYRVEENQHYSGDVYHVNVTPYPSGAVWNQRIPEITQYTRFSFLPKVLIKQGDIQLFEEGLRSADSTFFQMFSFSFKYGDPNTALDEPHSIVLTEEMANKYFGDENPLGKALNIENQFEFMVTAVLEKLPDNSTITFDALIPFRFLDEIGMTSDSWGNNSIFTYVKLTANADLDAVGVKMTEIQREYNPDSRTDFMVNEVQRLRLHAYFGYGNDPGAIVFVYIFGAIGLFVLIIACINFINLTTARSSTRGKEIGIMKVVGAEKGNMIVQFVLESIFQVFIALFIALIMIGLLLGAFNNLTGKQFDLADMFNIRFIISYIVVAIVAGFIAGIYPAFFLSSFKAVDVLKGEKTKGKKSGFLRRILVIIQFVLSIFLAVSGIIIYSQLDYMQNKELGYNKENLITIPVIDQFAARYGAIKDELERNPLVEDVTASWLNPIRIGSNSGGVDWEGKDPDQNVLFTFNAVDYDFIETMGIEMISGRAFSREFPGDMAADTIGNFMVNEELTRVMGKENPVGDWFSFMGLRGNIVGVMKDYHFKAVDNEIEPLAVFLGDHERFGYIVLRLSGADLPAALSALQDIWAKSIPDYPLDYQLVEDELDNMYRTGKRMSTLFRYFTILATMIAALGLYGLSSFMAERRTREVGIRKIMGSSVSKVVVLLSREFLYLVLIAAVIGFPLSYLYLNNWIKDFPYRIDIGAMVFIIVGVGAVVISVLTVSIQSYRAAVANPVDSIRIE